MLRNPFNPLLSPHDDQPPASSGAGSETQAPAEGEETHQDPEKKEGEGDEPPPPNPAPEPEKTETAPSGHTPLSAFERTRLRALGMGAVIGRLEKSETALAAANAEVSRLNGEVTRLSAELGKQPGQIAAAAKGRENEVSNGVKAELTKLGLTEASAPSQISADATPEALLEKFHTLKGAEKTAFFRQHKAALKAAEAAKNTK